jgi:hypothetical protein
MMDAKSAAHKSDAPTASRCENPNLRPLSRFEAARLTAP